MSSLVVMSYGGTIQCLRVVNHRRRLDHRSEWVWTIEVNGDGPSISFYVRLPLES